MNAIHILSAQPWVERLGSTLLHFLWQGFLIAALYGVARRTALAARPNARYVLACATLAAMAVSPVITWSLLCTPAPHIAVPSPAAPSTSTSATVRDALTSVVSEVGREMPSEFLPWVVALWLVGTVAFGFRLLGGLILAERLRCRLVRPAPPEWQQSLDRLKARMGLFRPVRLLVSALVSVPAVVGWLRPVVLVPVGALAGLCAEQIEGLLLHELAHIRRHDYLVNSLQSVVEAVLFYHPAVWWLSGHIRTEREICCDDIAVSITGDAAGYARVLAELAAARPAAFKTAMGATGGSLADRIGRLLGLPRPASRPFSAPGVTSAAAFLAIAAVVAFGQPIGHPRFEVASIKPSFDDRVARVRPLPDRLTADASVQMLMQFAYAVQPFQIAGGPAWINSDRYEIEAKADADTSRARLFLMLESLLEDRFQLKTHRETRELPVYELVAAKGGLKLPSSKEGGCVNATADGPTDWIGGRMRPPVEGQLPASQCGAVSVMLQTGGARMQGGNVKIPDLVRALSLVLGRTVIDRTGFTGPFDVRLDFLPDESTPAMPPPPPGDSSSTDPHSQSIAGALQQKLGLRLESGKGLVEIIVVDHLERPSAN